MKHLFSGKKKLVTIPLIGLLGLMFFPAVIVFFIAFLVYRYIPFKKVKYAVISLLLFFGIGTSSLMTAGYYKAITDPATYQPKQLTNEQVQGVQTASIPVATIAPSTPPPSPSPSLTPRETAKVVYVTDGDTLRVSLNGKTENIKVIGINTPETVDPRTPVECFGKEASSMAKEILSNNEIQLGSDPTQGDRDKYQRLLRYVFVDDGVNDFGKLMVSFGYAYEYTYETPYKYQADYKKAQDEASNGKKGLWADNTCSGQLIKATPTPKPKIAATPKPVVTPKPVTSTLKPTQQPQTQSIVAPETQNTGGFSCNCKKPCTEISSCAEAQFQLNNCGCKQRDADGDGLACDKEPLFCEP